MQDGQCTDIATSQESKPMVHKNKDQASPMQDDKQKIRHRATRRIASEPETIDIFFSIPDAEKKEWVQALLRGYI